jgi:hypothetical protein
MVVYEFICVLIVLLVILLAAWKLWISKIPIVQVWLKKQIIEETQDMAQSVSGIDKEEVTKNKQQIKEFLKEE